jgi:putative restriction endonuclease
LRAYVGITDHEWYAFLRARPHIGEINFWRPGSEGSRFAVISSGEPFLFKTHTRHGSLLVGGAFLSGYERMRVSQAWALFGEGNGAASLRQMKATISKYRKQPIGEADDPYIGCVMLRDPAFFDERRGDLGHLRFASGIVQGRSYLLGEEPGSAVEQAYRRLIGDASARALPALDAGPVTPDLAWTTDDGAAMFGAPRLTSPRLGQQAFRGMVTQAYAERCAITGAKILPALEAAHIRPVAHHGRHLVTNGLLLRADVHLMFDLGLLGVHPRTRSLLVSTHLRDRWGNGEEFYARAGRPIAEPTERQYRPDPAALAWHLDECFQA